MTLETRFACLPRRPQRPCEPQGAESECLGVAPCPVCGSEELRLDEVEQAGCWLLAECPRCQWRGIGPASAPDGGECAPGFELVSGGDRGAWQRAA